MDPLMNMREIAKHMILLEDHLLHESRRCGDCIVKHLLSIEAFAEEGVSLNPDIPMASLFERIAEVTRSWTEAVVDGESVTVVARQIRAIRKVVMAIAFDPRGPTRHDTSQRNRLREGVSCDDYPVPGYMVSTDGRRKACNRALGILGKSYPDSFRALSGGGKDEKGKFYALLTTFYKNVCKKTSKYSCGSHTPDRVRQCEKLDEVTTSANIGSYMTPIIGVRRGQAMVRLSNLVNDSRKKRALSNAYRFVGGQALTVDPRERKTYSKERSR